MSSNKNGKFGQKNENEQKTLDELLTIFWDRIQSKYPKLVNAFKYFDLNMVK